MSKILDSLVETHFDEAQCVLLDRAEIIKLTAKQGSKIVSKPVCELSLPTGITIGGIIRDGEGMLVEDALVSSLVTMCWYSAISAHFLK